MNVNKPGVPKASQEIIQPIGISWFLPRFSIGVKFVSFVVLVALLAGAIGSFAAINISRDSIREEVLLTNLNQANIVAEFTSKYIVTVQKNIRVFAERPDVRQAAISSTPGQLQPALSEFVQTQAPLETSGLYDINGIQFVHSVINMSTLGQSFADRDWFQQAIVTGQPGRCTTKRRRS